MKTAAPKELLSVVHAQLLEQQRRAKPGLDAIRKLRTQLAEIDNLDRKSRSSANLHFVRAMGADVLWRGWLDRHRRELNMLLARRLAEQDHIMRDLKKAQGRHDVLIFLLNQAEADKKRRAVIGQEARLLEAGVRVRATKGEV